MASRLLPGRSAVRLSWNGEQVAALGEESAGQVMVQLMRQAEEGGKARLTPGHGVETSTMKKRTHIALGGFNWASESIEPVPGGGAELRSQASLQPNKIRGKLTLELGVGQRYAIFYHQKHDPFLRIPFDHAMSKFKKEVEKKWRAIFR